MQVHQYIQILDVAFSWVKLSAWHSEAFYFRELTAEI